MYKIEKTTTDKTYDKNIPLISCLCITHKKNLILKRAIKQFLSQTYLNKQLVIAYQELDAITTDFIQNTDFPEQIKTIFIDANKPQKIY